MRAAALAPHRRILTWAGAAIALLLCAVAANVAAETSLLVHLAGQPAALVSAARHVDVPGGLHYGTALAVDANGRLYVAERSPPRVRVLDTNGNERAVWDGRAGTPVLRNPTALSALPDGRIAILDVPHNSSRGGSVTLFTCPADGRHCASVPVAALAKPAGLLSRQGGGFLVADTANNRVAVLAPTGRVAASWGRYGILPGQFREPWGIAAGVGGVYVADFDDGLVEQFGDSGAFVHEWDTDGPAGALALGGGVLYVALPDGGGLEALRLGGNDVRRLSWAPRQPVTVRRPFGLAVLPDGRLLVADDDGLELYRVQTP